MNNTDTGLRGYLKWLQADQPGLYKIVAPQIAQRLPRAFSDYEQSSAMGALWGLGQDDTSASGTAPSDVPDAWWDPSGASATGTTTSPDVASVANSGPTSPDIAASVLNIVNGAIQTYGQYQTSQAKLDAMKQVNQAQMQHAAAGTPMLDIKSNSSGFPQIVGTIPQATGGSLAVAAVVVVAVLFFMQSRRAA